MQSKQEMYLFLKQFSSYTVGVEILHYETQVLSQHLRKIA